MRRLRHLAWAVVLCGVWAVSTAHATTIAATLSGADPNENNGAFTLGFRFSPNVAISVTALGFYDDFGDGFLDGTHVIGLWTSTGTLLASATASNTDPVTAAFFRFAAISPVSLAAGGDYIVAGAETIDNYTWNFPEDPPTITYAPEISFIENRYAAGSPLTFPNLVDSLVSPGGLGFIGGNFAFDIVPEPTSLILLASGLAGLGGVARRLHRRA